MPPLPLIVVLGAFVLLGLVVLGSLIRTYRSARLSPEAVIELDPAEEAPHEALAHHDLVGHAMEICGLRVEQDVALLRSGDGLEVWLRSWVDPGRTSRATATTVFERAAPGAEVSLVSFVSQATIAGEVRQVETHDSPVTTAWSLPRRQSVRLPGATPETLWHIHRARLETLPSSSVHPVPDDLGAELVQAHRDAMEEGVRQGHLERTEDGRLAYTTSGGVASAKCHLPPWRNRRDHADRRAADEWLVNL